MFFDRFDKKKMKKDPGGDTLRPMKQTGNKSFSVLDDINTIYGPLTIRENDGSSITEYQLYGTGKYKGITIEIRPGTEKIIGGDPACCDEAYDIPNIPPRQCVLSADNDRLFVEDLGSPDGTFVNDEKIGPGKAELFHWDELRLGDADFIIQRKEYANVSSDSHCWKCRKAYTDENDRYCRSCGTPRDLSGSRQILLEINNISPIYGPPPVDVHYHCPSCGFQWTGSNWNMDTYCPNCGNVCENDLPENEFRRER